MESKTSTANLDPQFDTNQSTKKKLEEEMLVLQKEINRQGFIQKNNLYKPSSQTEEEFSIYDYLAEGVQNVNDIRDTKIKSFLMEMKQNFKTYWNLMKFLNKEPSQILLLKTRKSLRSNLFWIYLLRSNFRVYIYLQIYNDIK